MLGSSWLKNTYTIEISKHQFLLFQLLKSCIKAAASLKIEILFKIANIPADCDVMAATALRRVYPISYLDLFLFFCL